MEKEVSQDQKQYHIKYGKKIMKESLTTQKKENLLTKFPNQNNTIFFLCDCRTEILMIDYDREYQIADLCIYRSQSAYMSFWQKMRHIFKILIAGTPYSDQIVLNKGQIKNLKNFLNSI